MAAPQKKKTKPVYHAVAGFLAGSVATTSLFPLDLIKVRFQADKAAALPSIYAKFRTILREEGVTALFAGITPALAASAVSWAGFFLFYERAKTRRNTTRDDAKSRGAEMLRDALSSIEAGAIMVFITNPLWLVKTRLQLQQRDGLLTKPATTPSRRTDYKGTVDALVRIAREEGLLSLYRGVIPALFLTTHGAIQLVVYEELKRLKDPSGAAGALALVYGSVAKLAASLATYPYQVVKTRVQQRAPVRVLTEGTGVAGVVASRSNEVARTLACVLDTWRHEGPRGFFKGVWPNSVRVIPSAAITFWAYELIVRQLPSSSSSSDDK